MKKLLFLLPVIAWIGLYFVWGYSCDIALCNKDTIAYKGIWWFFTDMFAFFIFFGLFMFALIKNTEN